MLLKRYSDIQFILDMDLQSGIIQVNKAMEKENENKYWDMYLARYQHMTKETFIPFEQFYKPNNRVIPSQEKPKSKEDILSDAENILAALHQSMKGG